MLLFKIRKYSFYSTKFNLAKKIHLWLIFNAQERQTTFWKWQDYSHFIIHMCKLFREAQCVIGVNSIHPLRAMPIGKYTS